VKIVLLFAKDSEGVKCFKVIMIKHNYKYERMENQNEDHKDI